MKIVEGIKELKHILKKMEKNSKQITEYAAAPDTERLHFGTKDAQAKEIRGLIQSNLDLSQNYLKIKQMIEKTNLVTVVEINGKPYTISELLVLKRTLARVLGQTYKALNDSHARTRLVATPRGEKQPIIEKFYDEREKNDGERYWDDLYHTIDSRLEVINATTELVEL
jgi:cysteinyl-tRNA synthetase